MIQRRFLCPLSREMGNFWKRNCCSTLTWLFFLPQYHHHLLLSLRKKRKVLGNKWASRRVPNSFGGVKRTSSSKFAICSGCSGCRSKKVIHQLCCLHLQQSYKQDWFPGSFVCTRRMVFIYIIYIWWFAPYTPQALSFSLEGVMERVIVLLLPVCMGVVLLSLWWVCFSQTVNCPR